MRRYKFAPQPSLFVKPIGEIEFDVFSRHELLPILMALQYLYVNESDRLREILEEIERDLNSGSDSNKGASGMNCRETLILASLRLGSNLDYDQLADLATNHRKIQQILGYCEFDQKRFARSTINDNINLLKAETLDRILSIFLDLAHEHCVGPLDRVRADTFVAKKNIHYPTDTNMLYDGTRKIIEISVKISDKFDLPGWRKHECNRCKIKGIQQEISKVARSRAADRDERLKALYVRIIEAAAVISSKAEETLALLRAKTKAEKRELEGSIPCFLTKFCE